LRCLLDTRTFLWWIQDDQRLSGRSRQVIRDGKNTLFLSAASSWEISVKWRMGLIRFPGPPGEFLADQLLKQRIETLPVQHAHACKLAELATHHENPFERMLIAQALVEGIPIVTPVPEFRRYPAKLIW
jgi:PIN domain nuclease of toxin-antitoxin system